MKKQLVKFFTLFCLILMPFTVATGCDYGNGDSWKESQGKAEEERRKPQSQPSTAILKAEITYPTENMIMEVVEGDRVLLTVEDNLSVKGYEKPYKWQIKRAGSYDPDDDIDDDTSEEGWADIGGSYASNRYYTTDAVSMENDGDKYRCVVTVYEVKDGQMTGGHETLTSKTFTIKVVEEPTPTPTPTPRPSAPLRTEEPDNHEHNYKDETRIQPEYEDQTVTVYPCSGCNHVSKTQEEAIAHRDANGPLPAHNGYRSNVEIDSKELPIYGYACNGCDFTTTDKAKMDEHQSANPGVSHDVTVEGEYFKCIHPDCSAVYTTSSEDDLKTHIRSHDSSIEDYDLYNYYMFGAAKCTCSCGEIFMDDYDAAMAHTDTPSQGHDGYQENVQIGTKKTSIRGYMCNLEDFSTKDIDAMEKHIRDNPGRSGHGDFKTRTETQKVKTGEKTVKTGYRICTICKHKIKN